MSKGFPEYHVHPLLSKHTRVLLALQLCMIVNGVVAQDQGLDRIVNLKEQKTTVYQALSSITELTGFFFIYDSKHVNSDKRVTLRAENISLRQLLENLLNDPSLAFRVIDQHILIYRDNIAIVTPAKPAKPDSSTYITIRGQIFDGSTREVLPFAAIGLTEANIGSISNAEGAFVLRIPTKYLSSSVTVSFLGYKPRIFPLGVFLAQKVDIFLETEYISIQEVIIRNIDPKAIILEAMERRSENYCSKPVYLTTFYREGVQKNNRYLSFSEAVFRVYKTPFSSGIEADQVKLLKSRKVTNIDSDDTLLLKLKAGVKSSLSLDIVKSVPDFLDREFVDSYNFTKSDIVSINSRNAYAISFSQRENIAEPLYQGTVYIDVESLAILSAEFEISPKHVRKAGDLFVVRKSRNFVVHPERVSYTVTYKNWNGRYYINHIRGDLSIKFRKKSRLFSDNFRAFLETATCMIDSVNVSKFDRKEVMRPNTIFADQRFSYDEDFWGDFNTIAPEESINRALVLTNSKIEQLEIDLE